MLGLHVCAVVQLAGSPRAPDEDRAILQALLHKGHEHFKSSCPHELALHVNSAPHILLDAEQLFNQYMSHLPPDAPVRNATLRSAARSSVQIVNLLSGRTSAVERGDRSVHPRLSAAQPSPANQENAQSTSRHERLSSVHENAPDIASHLVQMVAFGGVNRLHGFSPQFLRLPPPIMPPLTIEKTPLKPAPAAALLWDDAAEVAAPSVGLFQKLLCDAQLRALQPIQHKDFLLALVRPCCPMNGQCMYALNPAATVYCTNGVHEGAQFSLRPLAACSCTGTSCERVRLVSIAPCPGNRAQTRCILLLGPPASSLEPFP
jgi:hypothetical protein